MTPTATRPRETDEMGRITTPARFENQEDIVKAEAGVISRDQVRWAEHPDALVDTGATNLSLPPSLIDQLGLSPKRRVNVRTAGGPRVATIYSPVQLTIQGRSGIFEVTELPEGAPVLIGQIPLEWLDLVPLPKEKQLVPNPAHSGEWTLELY